MTQLLDQTRRVADLALSLGASEARVSLGRNRGVNLGWRDGRIETLEDHTSQGLSVSLFVDGRFSSHSTGDLRPEALEPFLREAVAMTRLLEPDPARSLPDPARYAGRAAVDLDSVDAGYGDVTAERRRDEARALEELTRDAAAALSAARGGPAVEVVSVSTGVGDHRGQSARVHTNGFEGEREGTSFYASASLTLKEADGKRPAGGGFTYRAHRGDLRPLEVVAREAAEEAFGKLGAQKLATGKYTTLVKAEAVGRLLGALLAPLSGGALQQRRSLWEGRLETQIASPLLTLRDDPHVPRGLSSSLWDGDGFATAPRPVIEAGVLKTFLIDDYHAKKMSLERGEPVWATGASLHSLQWDLGPLGFDALVADVRDGVMIDSFLGGNSNATTGELSLGCAGRRIRDGRLAEAVTEVNLSGNLKDLWRQLVAVGADSYPEGASNTPSCVFEGVQLSGV